MYAENCGPYGDEKCMDLNIKHRRLNAMLDTIGSCPTVVRCSKSIYKKVGCKLRREGIPHLLQVVSKRIEYIISSI
jgi:hypothetical protein